MSEIPVEALVNGGEATAGPPLGPALGPLGMPIPKVIAEINDKTREYDGLKVPIVVWINKETKEFRVEVRTPMTSALIIKEAGIEKGSGEPNEDKVGDLSLDQVIKIARMKRDDIPAITFKGAVKTVLGTMVSMGITVDDGMDPRVMQRMVDDGEYDELMEE
ncbi:50S ribosomal protein L11 [Candidatus Bathyarchaeota archaeon]|nr:50S ribosomal protein L11 [Candidatus Bathyarchaeota archaeon]